MRREGFTSPTPLRPDWQQGTRSSHSPACTPLHFPSQTSCCFWQKRLPPDRGVFCKTPCSHCSSAHPAGPGSLPQKPAGMNAPRQPLLTPGVDEGEPEAAPGPAATSGAEPSGPTQPGAQKISGKRATSMAPKHRADQELQPCTAVLQVQRPLLKKLPLHSRHRGNEKGRPKTTCTFQTQAPSKLTVSEGILSKVLFLKLDQNFR